jgi:molybdopterin synthase sulfur carrier subunit
LALVEFLGPIGREPMTVDIERLSQLKDILSNDSEIVKWLEGCAVAVNDELVDSLDREIEPSDKISLLPPVCGG